MPGDNLRRARGSWNRIGAVSGVERGECGSLRDSNVSRRSFLPQQFAVELSANLRGRSASITLARLNQEFPSQEHIEEECSMSYKVYMYNIPKVSEDGKQAIPVPDSQVKEFDGVDDAKIFAAEHKNNFDRVVLMQEDNEGQKMVVRYVDSL